ncbi:MAG: 23S rRNA (uracil(1939)-C(5))-methyltransferase RlmD [Ruminococcus sp.]|nr:23S rRNA (uracil(1939)-C(5))-methyltransferase RlmD [Ruminococcus sp.]
MKKNDLITLSVTSATAEGSGVGKTEEGMAVFVPLTAVGDVIKARILKVKKTYAFAKIEELITPSPSRIEPDCPQFRRCGGCVWRHIRYEDELQIKQQKVEDAVRRIGGIDAPLMPMIGSERIDRYRNKAQLPIGRDKDGKVQIGFYSFHSHRIIDCADCALQPECFKTVIQITRDFINATNADIYDEATGKGRLRHLYIRLGEVTNELMVCYVVNGNGLKQEDVLIRMLKDGLPNLKTVVFNSNREKTNVILGKKNRVAYGSGTITDELCGLRFKISPFSFWQVNRMQAERLYQKAREYAGLRGDEVLLDLYCGTGTIGLTMARDCRELIGVEIIEDAVRDAEQNAAGNGIGNARFICADAPEAAEQLKKEGVSPDVIILDPPRKGCGEALVKTIRQMNPKRVVYVSCDPATLARDLKYFSENGYHTQEITPCDMFPRTAHVETVVLLSRKNTVYNQKKCFERKSL